MSSSAWSRPIFNLNLAAWHSIRRRNPDPIDPRLELRIRLAGSAMSALGMLQTRLYRPAIDRLELRPPLFIVGHWRSGTTLLHELLALDDNFAAPGTYACFNPHHFLLARHRPLSPKQAVRPTGDIAVCGASPQEDEFALLNMGVASPYEAFIFPAAIRRFEALCDPDLFADARRLKWDDAITWILKATAYSSGANRRTVVKSPAHSFRIARLLKLFPGAAFIRIAREPSAVVASTLGLWSTMWKRYALTAPPAQEVLIERIVEIAIALERSLQGVLPALPAGTVATIGYEDLVADPRGAIALVYERLGLDDPSPTLAKVSEYMARHPRPASTVPDCWRSLLQRRWPALFDQE